MRVVHLPRRFTRHSWGGTETVVMELARRQRALGHDARILTTTALDARRDEIMDGVPVERLPAFYPYLGLSAEARHRLDQKGGNLFSFALRRRLLGQPFDLLHLHTGKRLGGIGRQVALRQNRPYVITLHGGVFDVPADESARWTAPAAGAFEWGKVLGWWVGARRVLEDAAAVICLAPGEADAVRSRIPAARVEVLPNGVDTDRFARGDGSGFRARHGISQSAALLGVIGRVDAQKGQLDAVRAFQALAASQPSAHLLIAGPVTDEDYARQLRATVTRCGLGHRVTILPGFPPGSPELVDAYHSADLVMVPSHHEPFGLVVLEAWVAGKPVVATRVGGIPSFAEHERSALLVPPAQPEALAAAAARLLGDRGLSARLAAAGRHQATTSYSWDAINARMLALYDDVLSAPVGRVA